MGDPRRVADNYVETAVREHLGKLEPPVKELVPTSKRFERYPHAIRRRVWARVSHLGGGQQGVVRGRLFIVHRHRDHLWPQEGCAPTVCEQSTLAPRGRLL